MMKRTHTWPWALCLALAGLSAQAQDTAHPKAAPIPQTRIPADLLYAQQVDTVHTIRVDEQPGTGLRWLAWGGTSADAEPQVTFGLVPAAARATSMLWSVNLPDAYDPQLLRISDWQYAGHPLLALTYRFGAAAQQIDLYGLGSQQQPEKLATLLAEQIEWQITPQGQRQMMLYQRVDGAKMSAHCYRWQERSRKLGQISCR